jgi:hypothetical protein
MPSASESDTAVRIKNPLLEKWRTHAKELERLHGVSYSLFKGRADKTLFTTIALSLGVGCLYLTYGIEQPPTTTKIPAIVNGCLSLLSGSVAAVSTGLNGPNKVERHNDYSSRFGEFFRDIITKCTLRHLNDVKFTPFMLLENAKSTTKSR